MKYAPWNWELLKLVLLQEADVKLLRRRSWFEKSLPAEGAEGGGVPGRVE